MKKALGAICDVMMRIYGRDISPYDDSFLEKSINRRLQATGIKSLAGYGEILSGNEAEAKALFHSLTNTTSEFFRNALTFSLLEKIILPSLVAKKKSGQEEIRIWSAACAAGQEAYSIAMLLSELAAAKPPVLFRIFATDISESELDAARAGVYDFNAVKNVPLRFLRESLIQDGERYAAGAALKERIDFSLYNLLDEHSASPPVSIYGDFDLIVCSNILFYYRADIRRRILDKLHRALAPEGYLVTGEAEREIVAAHKGFRPVFSTSAVFQKRMTTR